jgi:hypothetical protein
LLNHNASAPDSLQTQLQAQLEVVQVAPQAQALRLIAPRHQMHVNGQTLDLTPQVAALTRPCYLMEDAQGRIQTLSFAPETPSIARNLMRALVSDLEFARSDSNARQWRVQQDTVNGIADVAYRALDGAAYEKRILDYPIMRQIGPKGNPEMHYSTQGALRFTFRQEQLQSVDGTLVTHSALAKQSVSASQERFTLNRIGAGIESPAALSHLNAERLALSHKETPTALHIQVQDAVALRTSWEQLLEGATLESLLKDMQALDARGDRNDSTLYSHLYALLMLHPEMASALERHLMVASPDKVSTKLALSALSAVAASPERSIQAARASEQTLCELLAARHDQPEAEIFLAPALGTIPAARPETWQLLRTLSQSKDSDTATACTLALGSIARRNSPATQREITHYLVHRLATSNDSFKEHVLAALGNAGSADSLDAVAAYTHHRSSALRSVAYMSLRFIPSPRVMALLYRGLNDPDLDVRLNAARALQFRPFSDADVRAVERALHKERADSVRLTLLENLKLEADYHPQVRPFLKQACQQDTSSEVRQTLAEWLRQ